MILPHCQQEWRACCVPLILPAFVLSYHTAPDHWALLLAIIKPGKLKVFLVLHPILLALHPNISSNLLLQTAEFPPATALGMCFTGGALQVASEAVGG